MTDRPRSWQEMWQQVAGQLERQTGAGVDEWDARVRATALGEPDEVRRWLTEQGVVGYPRMLLLFERFGYPDYLTASAEELVDGQYADRPQLRPILDRLLEILPSVGGVSVQARKTYISLLTSRRTFAAIQASTKRRVDLGLRLDGQRPEGRLDSAASMGQSAVTVRIGLASPDEVDDEVLRWLRRAYGESA